MSNPRLFSTFSWKFLFRNVAEDEPRVWTDLVQIVHLPSNRTKWSDNLFPGVTLITILLREKTWLTSLTLKKMIYRKSNARVLRNSCDGTLWTATYKNGKIILNIFGFTWVRFAIVCKMSSRTWPIKCQINLTITCLFFVSPHFKPIIYFRCNVIRISLCFLL